MAATVAVSRLGPTPTSPSSVQWSLPRRRLRLLSVRALKNSEDGEETKTKDCATDLSRRALIALIALSSTQIGGVASARSNTVTERRIFESLRTGQRKNAGSEVAASPAAAVEAPSVAEGLNLPSSSPAEELVSTPVSSLQEAVKSAFAGDATEVSLPQEFASEAQKISSSVSNGSGLFSLAGAVGAVVAGAFYYLERQSKTEAESALESANKKLEEAVVSMKSLRKSSEGQLLAEKEQALKAASIAQEQRTTLANELMDSRTSASELLTKLQTEKASVADLQKKLSKLQASLVDQEKSSASLNKRFVGEREASEQLRAEISKLKSNLAEQESDYNSVYERLVEEIASGEQLQEEIRALKVSLEGKENEVAVQTGRVTEAEDNVAKLQAQLRSTESQLAGEKDIVATLHDKLRSSETQLADERSRLGNLESSFASSQGRNQQLEISVSGLKQNLESTTRVKEELEKEVGRLNEAVSSVKSSLAEELEKKETLVRQLRDTTGAFEKATVEVTSLEIRLSEMSAAKKAFEKEKKDEISHLTRELQEKRKSLESAVERDHALSDEIVTLRSRQADLNQELEHTHQDLEASTDEIRTISEQLTVAVNLSLKLETQLNETRSLYQTTKTALGEERKVTAAAKSQLAMSQRSLVTEKNSVKALRGSVDQALQALQELNQDSVALADELEKAKKHIATVESEAASVRQKLVKEKEVSANLRAGNAQTESNVSKLVKENEAVHKKVKQLEGELLKGKGEIARQKGKLLEQKRALQQAETRLKMIPQVRAEAALLVEKYEDLAFQEKEQKEALILQNEKLRKSGKNVGADLTDVKQSLEDGKAARSEMETALGSLQEAVADNSS